MSLDEDPMREKQRRDEEPADLTRTRLSEKEIHASAKIALEKKRMGLPISDADRMALKTSRVLDDLKQEKS